MYLAASRSVRNVRPSGSSIGSLNSADQLCWNVVPLLELTFTWRVSISIDVQMDRWQRIGEADNLGVQIKCAPTLFTPHPTPAALVKTLRCTANTYLTTEVSDGKRSF